MNKHCRTFYEGLLGSKSSDQFQKGNKNLISNCLGVSLVELMISIGVSGVLLSLSSHMYFKFLQITSKAQVISSIGQMSHQYITLLASDVTLKNSLNKLVTTTPPITYATRSPFGCLFTATATACSGPTWTPSQNDYILQVYDNAIPESGGTPQKVEPKVLTTSSTSDAPLAANLQTNGFNTQGEVCDNFNPSTGSDSCPFQVRASWTPICPLGAATCTHPKIKIRVKFVYHPLHIDEAIAAINLDKYEISLEKEPIGPNVLMANSEQSLVFYYQDYCPDMISPTLGYCYAPPPDYGSNSTPPTYTNYVTGAVANTAANEYVTEKRWVQNINVGTQSIVHVQVNAKTLYNQWVTNGNPTLASSNTNIGPPYPLPDSSLPGAPSTYVANAIILVDGVLCSSSQTMIVYIDTRFISAAATCIKNLDAGTHQIDIIGQSIVTPTVPKPGVNYIPWIQVGTVSVAVYK